MRYELTANPYHKSLQINDRCRNQQFKLSDTKESEPKNAFGIEDLCPYLNNCI